MAEAPDTRRVLGIDPGTRVVGWGIVERDGPRLRAVAHGTLRADGSQPIETRLAVIGAAERLESRGRHVITTQIEHPAILDPCAWLEKRGFQITRIAPDETGRVSVESVEKAITPETISSRAIIESRVSSIMCSRARSADCSTRATSSGGCATSAHSSRFTAFM